MPRNNDKINEINKLVGSRIQTERISVKITRMQLAEKIDVSHQQVLKYETGDNLISVGRLAFIAQALNQPIEYFLKNLNDKELTILDNMDDL